MEKRALLAIALSVVVMAAWYLLFPPPTVQTPPGPPAPAAEATPPGDAANGAGRNAPPAAPQVAVVPAPAAASSEPVRADAREEFRVITATQDVRFTNEGGCATWWRLTKYTINGGVPVDLIPEEARRVSVLPLQVQIDGDAETTRALRLALYRHELTEIAADDPGGSGPGKRVTFTYADGNGLAVRKVLELPETGYLGRVSFEVMRHGRPVAATLIWASGLAQQAEDDTRGYGHIEGEAVVRDGGGLVRIAPAKATSTQSFGGTASAPPLWAGLNSTYFASLVLPSPGGPSLSVTIEPHEVSAAAGGSSGKPVPLLTGGLRAEGGGAYRLFVGPKDYNLLKSMGFELERVIDFSRFSLIYVCTKALFLALTWINSYVGNYGWSIILLTFVVRVAFFPIMYRSSITMRQTSKKMAKVQPRVKAIQDRYRKMKKSMETQRQMNEEIMALYKKEGINPMANLGGCLPLLLQMPIFIGFYNLLAVTIEMRHAPFIFWLHDLSRRDPYYITPLLMGGSWLAQQWMTSSSIPDPTQRRMMMFMPVMFTFFMMNMPSGLVVYWLTSNLLGMAQQYLTNRKADQLEAEARGKGQAAQARRGEDDGSTARGRADRAGLPQGDEPHPDSDDLRGGGLHPDRPRRPGRVPADRAQRKRA